MKKLINTPFWRSYGMSILACVAAAVIFLAGTLFRSQWNEDVSQAAEKQTAVTAEEQQIQTQQRVAADNKTKELVMSVTGTNLNRKAQDDMIAEDIIGAATNWKTAEEYITNREQIFVTYEWLNPEDSFFTDFFSPAEDAIVRDGSGDIVADHLSDGRNMKLLSVDSHVLSIENDVYSYAAIVTVQSDGVSGGGTVNGYILVTYESSLTDSGMTHLSNLAAYSIYRT